RQAGEALLRPRRRLRSSPDDAAGRLPRSQAHRREHDPLRQGGLSADQGPADHAGAEGEGESDGLMREGKYISVDGVRTHYFEAGESHRGRQPTILLLHSAEYGGAAEFSWEFNLQALGRHYHVLAPDHLGFGLTDKIFDFNGQFDRRIAHIRRFIEVTGVGPVHVMGSSMSGGLSLTVAARKEPDWSLLSVVCCSGGGDAPNNDQRKVINTYDGSREHMRRILEVMFIDPKWPTDEAYLDRRWEMALVPGAWEATSAARFKAP